MDDFFEPDPFMETLAAATGKVYPSAGTMRWATRLADQYGEQLVMKAIGYVVTKKGAQPHEVLGMAEQALEYRSELQAINEERRKRREQEEARMHKNQEQIRQLERLGEGFAPVSASRVAEIMADVPVLADKSTKTDGSR
jgi:hypothetical protein